MKDTRKTFEYDDVLPIFISFLNGKSVSKLVLTLIAGEITLKKKNSMYGSGTLFYVHAKAYNSHYLRVFADEVSEVIDSAILDTKTMIDGPVESETVYDTVVFYWFTK